MKKWMGFRIYIFLDFTFINTAIKIGNMPLSPRIFHGLNLG